MFNDLKLAFNAGKDLKLNCKQASATIAAATTPAATCLCCAPCCLMILHASCHVPFCNLLARRGSVSLACPRPAQVAPCPALTSDDAKNESFALQSTNCF